MIAGYSSGQLAGLISQIKVGSIPAPATKCPDDGIGIRVGLRSQILRVRVSLGAPNLGDVAQR